MKNQVLAALEQKLEGSLNPQQGQAFHQIVLAGMKVMFDPSTHDQMFNGALEGNIPARLAMVTVGIFKILQKQSQNMPMDVGMIALVDLYLHALDFAASAGKLQIDPPTLKAGLEALGRLVQQQLLAGQHQADQAQQPPAAPAAAPAAPAAAPGGIVQGAMQ